MFKGCSSLTSLNISNFKTSMNTCVNGLFQGCTNLGYINMINFNDNGLTSSSTYYSNIFEDVPDNVVICINKDNPNNIKVVNQIHNIACSIIDCSDNWMLKQKKIIDILQT
jgi:surface protein